MARPPAPLDPAVVARLHTAAAHEFGALGLEHASLNRILTAAGMGKSTFYHRYENKQALYRELIDAVKLAVDDALRSLETTPTTKDEFWSSARGFLASLDAAVDEHPELNVVAGLMYTPDAADDLRVIRGKLLSRVQDRLVDGRRLGAVRTDVPASLLAEVVVAALLAVDAWTLAHTDDEPTPHTTGAQAAGALAMIRDVVKGN